MSRRRSALFLATLLLGGLPKNASAEHADAQVRDPAQPSRLLRLAPTDHTLHDQRTRLLEQRLVRVLTGWPNIAQAEVMLELPLASAQPLDAPPARTAAVVVLTRATRASAAGARPTDDEVYQLLRGVLPTLSRDGLTVLSHASASTRARLETALFQDGHLVTVGPFQVAERSAPALRLALAFSLAIHALFAGIVLWRLRPNRPAARKVDRRARTSSPP